MKETKVLPSQKYMKLRRFILTIAYLVGVNGLVPPYKMNRFTILAYFILSTYYICLLYSIVIVIRKDWKLLLEVFVVAGFATQGAAKLLSSLTYTFGVSESLKQFQKIYQHFEKESESYEKILHEGIDKLYLFGTFIAISYAISIFSFYIAPIYYLIYKGERILLLNVFIPGLDVETDFGFACLYGIQFVLTLAGGVGNCVFDLFFLVINYNICVLTDIFREKVRMFNINSSKIKRPDNEIGVSNIQDIVGWLEIISKFNHFAISISFYPAFFEVVCCGFALLLSIFIIIAGDWPAAYAVLTTNFCQLYTYCFIGSAIENSADDLITLIYEIEWYHLNVADQKLIAFMLMKFQKKSLLTVGALLPLSVSTGLQVTKTVYSFSMMLLNFVSE